MAKKGVSKISGNTAPVIGEKTTYQVSEWYAGTTARQRNSSLVTWELFKKRRNGTFTTTHIRKKGVNHFTFGQVAAGETYRLEAYLFHPEGRGLLITPQTAAVPKIKKVELLYVDNTRGSVFSFFEKLRAQATCVNMLGKELVFTLWEEDKTGPGHHAGNQPIESKKAKVNKNGIAVAEFALTAALMRQAAKGEVDSQLEFYVTVEYYAHKKHATNNVHVSNPYYTVPATSPAPTAPKPEQNLPAPAASAPATPAKEKEENKNNTGQRQPTDSQQASGTATVDQPPTAPVSDGKSDAVVKDTKIEGIIDAYFAKKDFTKLTGQEAGNYTYTFGGKKAANNTSNTVNKEKVANAILSVGKVNDKLKTEKKYTTKEAIASALTATEYGTDTTSHKTVTFKTFALGEEFKKIGSAPLEEKVYLVVSTYLLQEKNATITVKEKDGIIQGSAGAALPISQISEAKMNSTEALTEVDRTEKTTFTGALAKVETGKDAEGKPISSEMLAIPVQLRPKSDDDLAKWKEKLNKGRPDGTYTYTFKNSYGVVDGNKAELAAAIVKNATNGSHGNPKLESGKTAHADDVKKALETKTYASGATVTFPVYRKETEMLWLEVSATGSKEHKKEFLKGEGAYFEIGNRCSCNRNLTESELKEILKYLRASENLEISDIWKPKNAGGASPSDSSLSSMLAKLNDVMNKYEINSCIRKVYFIAECYHETDRFYSTQEYDSAHTAKYDPYRGRGIIQITHKEAYERYSDYKGDDTIVSNYAQMATNLEYAFDSAGWYWKQGKKLNKGSSWAPSSDAKQRYNLNPRSYPKINYESAFGGYGSVNLNLVADNDDIDVISYLINGGDNGLAERKKYLTELKKIDIFKCGKNQILKTGDWHHPLSKMELRGWYNSGFHPSSSDHGDAPVRIAGKHDGLDLYAPAGTQVYACVKGKVHEIYESDTYGKTINIKGTYKGQSYYFFYAHLSEISINAGDSVELGAPIGKTGQTGNAEGQAAKMNHLHFEVRTTGERTGGKVDPLTTIQELGADVDRNPNKETQTGI